MRKEENKFDQWLQEQLDGHESPLPHASWSAATQARKRRKWFFIFLLAGSSLAASLVLGFYLGRETAPTPNETLTQNTTQADIASKQAEATETPNSLTAPELSPVESPSGVNEESQITQASIAQNTPVRLVQPTNSAATEANLIALETPLEFSPIEAKSLANIKADLNNSPSKLYASPVALSPKKSSSILSRSWDLSLESGLNKLSTHGAGPWAGFYDELMKDQRFSQFSFGLGINRTWETRNWQYSAGLQLSKYSSNNTYRHISNDSIVPSGVGSGGIIVNQAMEDLSSQTLQHSYTSLSLPVRAYYRFYTLNRFEFLAGLGLNLSYNFNHDMLWYSTVYGAKIGPQFGTLRAWKFGQELMLSAAYRYRADKSIRLSYVLSAPKGQQYKGEEFTLNGHWQHSLRLQFYIP